jgi:predicted PurR-regulated permease PerM
MFESASGEDSGRQSVIRRTVMVLGVSLAILIPLFLLGYAAKAALVVFGGILFAVLLRALAALVTRFFNLTEGKALVFVVVLLFGMTILIIWWVSPRLSDQLNQLAEQLPASLQHLEQRLKQLPWGQWVISKIQQPRAVSSEAQHAVSQAADVLSLTLEGLGFFIIVLFLGIYFAIEPGLYFNGFLSLLPIERRNPARIALLDASQALQRWLVGRLLAMAFVGAITGLGLWLLNVCLAFSLGLLAGLLGFIPYIGPLISGVPAVLLTLQQEGGTWAVYVVLLYFGVQTVQDYLLTR